MKKGLLTSKKQFNKIFQILEYDPVGLRDRVMITLLFQYRLSISQCPNIKVEDLHLKKKQIEIPDRLTGKNKIIRISDKDLIQIRDYLNYGRPILTRFNQKEESFFVSYNGSGLNKRSLYKRLKYLKKKAAKMKFIHSVYERYMV